jgi:hypothetical protein
LFLIVFMVVVVIVVVVVVVENVRETRIVLSFQDG